MSRVRRWKHLRKPPTADPASRFQLIKWFTEPQSPKPSCDLRLPETSKKSSKERTEMLKASAGKILPTTIIGSLPRPSWYTENLGTKSFLDAMVISRFREQYVDALSV